jgi:uncharacterized membrane protein YkvA (DUF1232 family)
MWLRSLIILIGALAALWLLFVIVLAIAKPDGHSIRETARLLPDVLRLVKRLATDRSIPRVTRLPVWLLLAYLVSPIDLVPDFVPVVGYADDAIITSLVLRWFIRRAGADKVSEHWPGTPGGLAAVLRVLRIRTSMP